MTARKPKGGRTKPTGTAVKAVRATKAVPATPVVVKAEPAKVADADPAPVEAKAETLTTEAFQSAPVEAGPVTPAPEASEPESIEAEPVRPVVAFETKFERNDIVEGIIKMTTKTEAVTDRVQAIFGEVNERARTAFETNARLVEEFTDISRGNVEALVASSKVAARGVESLGQEAAEYGRKSFEDVSSALRGFSAVKSPTDLFRLQSDFAKSQFDSIVAESSRISEAVLKLAGEVFEPLSSRYTVAAERVKNVVAA